MRREANSILPRRVRRPFTNMRQRSVAIAESWRRRQVTDVISRFHSCTNRLPLAASGKLLKLSDLCLPGFTNKVALSCFVISSAWSGTSVRAYERSRSRELCRNIVWREYEEQRGHEVVRRSSPVSKVTHPLATLWSWLLAVIPGNEAASPQSTIIDVVSVVLAEQVSIIHGRQWRSSIAEDCLRHSGASSCDLGERRATRVLWTLDSSLGEPGKLLFDWARSTHNA
jgi:hypothetical protein